MQGEVIGLFVALAFIGGAVALIITAMNNRRHIRETQHRERIAMIERGVMPSPEADPAGFEASAGLEKQTGGSRRERFRTAGVTLVGIGLALMVLITFTGGEPEIGIGIGGAWVMVGAALIVNAMLLARDETPPSRPASMVRRDPEPPADVLP